MKIKKTESIMVAIPQNGEDCKNIDVIMENIKSSKDYEFISESFEEEELVIKVKYKEEEYDVRLFPINVEIPEMFKTLHIFSDMDIKKIEAAEIGVLIALDFGENPLDSYHLQVKLANAMFDDLLVVIDESSEKLLSGKWVKLCAASKVAPSPKYIYTVQAISSNVDSSIWLHTHGLNRCGLPELEIIDSDQEMYYGHYNVIDTMGRRLLEIDIDEIEENEPIYLARITEDIPFWATLINWKEALEDYDEDVLGKEADRDDFHMVDTCVICCYPTPEAFENREYAPVSVFDEFLEDNPIYMLSQEETLRMKALATERVNYLVKYSKDEEANILVKIGLEVDDEYKDDENAVNMEHIWFELHKVENGKLVAELTQEPYYVKDLHPGDVREVEFANITDWIIYKDGRGYTPDDVYMLDEA